MATDPETARFIAGQMEGAGEVALRKMFGEYAVYLDGRVVALICGNQLFVKPTPVALSLYPGIDMAAPYPGARLHMLGDALLDEPDALAGLVRQVAVDLPPAKPKSRRAKADR